jgi:hypothetical protein
VSVGVNNIQQAQDIGVLHLLEQADLSDGGRRHAFIFGFETDLFECDDTLIRSAQITRFVDDTVCACRLMRVVSFMLSY